MSITITGDGPKITATGSGSTVLVEISTGQHDPGSFSGVHNDLSGRSTTAAHPGTAIAIDPTEFDGNLDETVVNAQLLAAAVDELTVTGGAGANEVYFAFQMATRELFEGAGGVVTPGVSLVLADNPFPDGSRTVVVYDDSTFESFIGDGTDTALSEDPNLSTFDKTDAGGFGGQSAMLNVFGDGVAGATNTLYLMQNNALVPLSVTGGGAESIDDLTDVDTVTDPADVNDVLAWDGTNWTPATLTGGSALSDADPEDLGTADSGTSDEASRADHVHAMPTAGDVGALPDDTVIPDLGAHTGDTTGAHAASAISVGTLNGILASATATDVETALQAVDNLTIPAAGIPATIIDAKGDLIVGSAADTASRLAVSATNGAALVADSGEATGLNWATDPFIVTIPGATPTLLAAVANWGVWMRCYGSGTISKIALQIGTSAGDISVGVYSNTGSSYLAKPITRVATSGAVACPASGYQEIALGSSVYVRTGDWLAVSFSSGSATAFGVAAPGSSIANQGLSYARSGQHPLPETIEASVGDRQFRLWGVA